MLRWLRLFPVIFAALWLPFSAVAAVTMPFCQHGGQHEQMAHSDHAGMQHDHETMEHDVVPAHDGAACDQCGFCHLACAGMMPTQESSGSALPLAHEFAVSPAPTFLSLTAEPLPRPPRLP